MGIDTPIAPDPMPMRVVRWIAKQDVAGTHCRRQQSELTELLLLTVEVG